MRQPSGSTFGQGLGREGSLKRRSRRQIAQAIARTPIDLLEGRLLLSSTPVAHITLIDLGPVAAPSAVSATSSAASASASSSVSPASSIAAPFTPAEITNAYGVSAISFGGTVGNGAGETIAIVDAYNDPDIITDANSFSTNFGLPDFNGSGQPTLKVLNQTGGTTVPSNSSPGGWDVEESLDVEWAHAIAPEANIDLFEANSASFSDLLTAVRTAADTTGVCVVSQSWSGSEFSGESSYDSDFTTPVGHSGVTFLASTGDSGTPAGYPATSPNVIGVGGTTLTINSGNTYGGETGWSDGGGSVSPYEPLPTYQDNINGANGASTTKRNSPDVSMDANPSSGVYVLDSFYTSSYLQVGGTSLSCPMFAGVISLADQGRAINGLSSLDGATQTLPDLYNLSSSDFHDITSGNNGLPAGVGYDLVTGIGSPVANLLVPALASAGASSQPEVTTNPTGETVTAGQTATFTAAASGSPTPTVQWYSEPAGSSSFTAISGATSTTLSLSTVTSTMNGGEYEAVFTNVNGSATTVPATLTVVASSAPQITLNPYPEVDDVNAQIYFNATASGNPTPTVQWYVEPAGTSAFTAIAGGTSSQLFDGTATISDNGNQYKAVFTNSLGSATTTTVTLLVYYPPMVTTNPASQSVTSGQNATFAAAASGNPAPTVQWYVELPGSSAFNAVSGATSSTLNLGSATASENGNQYEAVFTNSSGSSTTTPATLTVIPAPTGSLSGTQVAAASSYNLTTLGTSDWAAWGAGNSATAFDHKASGNSQISNVTKLGTGAQYGSYFNTGRGVSWSDGTPLASDSEDDYIWANTAIGAGYSFTVPASTTTQKLYVYAGGYSSGGQLTAHLSDGSAADYVVSASGSGSYANFYTITFKAASAGQTLTISYVKTTNINGTGGSVDLIAAALAGPPAVDTTPPTAGLSSAPSLTAASSSAYQFVVTYIDNVAVNASTLGNNNLLVTGPSSYSQVATLVSTGLASGPTITATYSVPAPAGGWSNSSDGNYTVALQANQVADTSGNYAVAGNLGSFTVNIPVPGAGSLSGTQVTAASSYNLTTLGTSDWAAWGAGNNATAFDHKASGNSQISNVTKLGTGAQYGSYFNTGRGVSWSDGTPLASDSEDDYIWANTAIGAGYSFTVPASTTTHTLYVYAGGYSSGGQLTAHLSDGSAADYMVAASGSGTYTNLYTITFKAASAGQTLTISYVKTTNINGTGGSVDLIAAALA